MISQAYMRRHINKWQSVVRIIGHPIIADINWVPDNNKDNR
jgi:hypothetical protein